MTHAIARFRVVAMLLCAVVAFSVTAAPAPVYKHRPPKVWFDGWDEPIDKLNGCRFARKGEKLTITVPGSNRNPALLREVEGDFVLQVRVSGEFHSPGVMGDRKAGIVLQFGGTRVRMDRVTEAEVGKVVTGGFSSELKGTERDGGQGWSYGAQDASNISHFRVRRKGNELILEAREDKGEWMTMNNNCPALTLPRKIKVGVSAEATTPGPFHVEFDQFELTKPAK